MTPGEKAPQIVIAGKAMVRLDNWEEAVRQVEQMMAASEAEPGCLSYRISVHPSNRRVFYIFEEWEDEAALQRHFQTVHLAQFSRFLTTVEARLDVKRYDVSAVGSA
jgi:quinol monooxygenase YgiN